MFIYVYSDRVIKKSLDLLNAEIWRFWVRYLNLRFYDVFLIIILMSDYYVHSNLKIPRGATDSDSDDIVLWAIYRFWVKPVAKGVTGKILRGKKIISIIQVRVPSHRIESYILKSGIETHCRTFPFAVRLYTFRNSDLRRAIKEKLDCPKQGHRVFYYYYF